MQECASDPIRQIPVGAWFCERLHASCYQALHAYHTDERRLWVTTGFSVSLSFFTCSTGISNTTCLFLALYLFFSLFLLYFPPPIPSLFRPFSLPISLFSFFVVACASFLCLASWKMVVAFPGGCTWSLEAAKRRGNARSSWKMN
jgi:hypothetical protein